MKHAAAMKYEGELVAAEDCTYDSFKELVPLCPHCKEPVFLQKAHTSTSSKGKEFKVGAAWSHFRGVSAEQVALCENRVSGYTDKDRQSIASKARGQRLKLLQRWFLDVYLHHDWMHSLGELSSNKMDRIAREYYHSPIGRQWEPVIKWYKNSIIAASGEDVENAIYTAVDACYEVYRSRSNEKGEILVKTDESTLVRWALPLLQVERGLHKKICTEVYAFLICPQNRNKLLERVLIWCSITSQWHMKGGPSDNLVKREKLRLSFLSSIAAIPWAAEFQRLEAESKQKKVSA